MFLQTENWYTCCPFPYIELHAHLVIQRKPLYYIVNLVIPIFIIAVIAAFGFFTPVSSKADERTERVELGVNTLLAMSILLVIVADQMPTTSNSVPLISWFYLVNIVLIAVGTVLSSVVMIIQQQGHYGKQVPKRLSSFFHSVGPFLCICPIKVWKKDIQRRKSRYFVHSFNRKCELVEDGIDTNPLLAEAKCNRLRPGTPFAMSKVSNAQDLALLREVRSIKNILYSLQESRDLLDRDSAIKVEWEYLAVVLDRALLLIFTFLLVFFIAVFFSYGFSLLDHDDDPATIHW